MNSWIDNDSGAQPHIILNDDRTAILVLRGTRLRVDRMSGSRKSNIRGDLHVIADDYRDNIKHDAVIVADEVIADVYVITIVAAKGSIYPGINTDRAENRTYQGVETLLFIERTGVEFGKLTAALALLGKHIAVAYIRQPRLTFVLAVHESDYPTDGRTVVAPRQKDRLKRGTEGDHHVYLFDTLEDILG